MKKPKKPKKLTLPPVAPPTSRELADAMLQSPIMRTDHWTSIVAVSLNFKEFIQTENGIPAKLTDEICRKELTAFCNELDRRIYKNAVVRYAKKVRRIVFLEKGNDRSWHNHLALERPERISEVKFRNLIRECWSRSEWAVPNKDIQFDGNRGWIEYIHKPRSKAVFLSWTDSIVLEACVNDTK
jgi:hypothetical protein